MSEFTIVFDVGGLYIKAAVLNQYGKVVPNTYAVYPSKSKENKDELLNHFVDLFKQQVSRIMEKQVQINGIGFAFPGPFDYEEGTCYIQGGDKFESIYGVNLRTELMQMLSQESFFAQKQSADFHIVFENDANLFALGELVSGKVKSTGKSICITIGAGLGSTFIENGEMVKYRDDVPNHGWMYAAPFRDSIVDDYISRRGFNRLKSELGIDLTLDIRDLMEAARQGDLLTASLFHSFGLMLGEMLIPFVQAFKPEALFIAGEIAKSHDLFIGGCRAALEGYELSIEISDEASMSTFIGVSKLLEQSKQILTSIE
ncbi:ROK family protein [Paenibacillus psychroresistens]|uniref:ROK family protein n=1 Tax=Paenibacillus psychroresistens TaxID=1778678 RepID=A0A6B8RVV6_9BACL|nr:ROK family protein [Paenibacillus psychroresistens]QGQ99785.1 ROK family protein [Paenibacillus psychroresistens]